MKCLIPLRHRALQYLKVKMDVLSNMIKQWGHTHTHTQEPVNVKIKQAMIPLQGMAEHRFTSVLYLPMFICR